ncbi:MAG TPA: tetratricopeptide repeat protein [Bryobacteraceae bacterium]|nr:tetratricopeptide repeat protein [Bryobacteraceae bacterium]
MAATAPREFYTRQDVRRMLGVTERQLRAWEKHGLVSVLQNFNLADVKFIRTLQNLAKCGVSAQTLRLIVTAMRDRVAGVSDPLKELKLIPEGRRVRVEIGGQRFEAISGQMLFDFESAELKRLLSFPTLTGRTERRVQRENADAWFQKGLELEQKGAPIEEITKAYEMAVSLDPASAGAWLNLGTIHFNARGFAQAERYYRKALEADPNYALAHFNLGNLYDERGDWGRALDHYNAAVRLNASYADAHYNLALLNQNRGRVLDALRHWRAYLKLDASSQWAEIARRELEKLKKSTVVQGRAGEQAAAANEKE